MFMKFMLFSTISRSFSTILESFMSSFWIFFVNFLFDFFAEFWFFSDFFELSKRRFGWEGPFFGFTVSESVVEIIEIFDFFGKLVVVYGVALIRVPVPIPEIRCDCLTPRRPIGKVTPTCPICRARQFRWRRCLRVLKFSQTFSQVLKTLISLLNSKFISEIAGNWLFSSHFLVKKIPFMVLSRLWVCALTILAWLIDDELISLIPFLINN